MQTYCYDEDPVLGACGISIEKQLTRIDGRVLEAPKVNLIFSLLMCKRGVYGELLHSIEMITGLDCNIFFSIYHS